MVRSRSGKRLFAIITFLLCISGLRAQQAENNKSEFLPDLDGIIKTKIEYDLDNSLMRFEVRNARFGVKGKINNYMSYKLELDLSDEGKMKMLDAYVRYTPVSGLDFYMGQRKIPFSTDYMRSPADNLFANRSFLAKYINDGMRDIGFYADYRLSTTVPVDILVGAVNGTGNNNPQWIEKPNLVSRITAGPDQDGFRITGNFYYGEVQYKEHLAMFGGELRYSMKDFFIESECIRGNWTDTSSVRQHDAGIYIHSYYNFHRENKIICLVTPVARYDMMGKSIFFDPAEASRVTFGLNLGFEPRQFYSEIRFNYENYLKGYLPVHTDKFTIEFIGRF